MKKLLIIAIPLLTAFSSCAQEIPQSSVPSVVVNAFQQKFPKASGIEWEKKGDLYEAEFDLKFEDHKVLIDGTGKIVKHKEEINAADLPAVVKETIKKGFSTYKIDDADRIETQGLVIYKVELENSKEDKKIYIGEDGKIIDANASYE
ncbi:MAG: hypothetical protein JWM14_2874 [Chitinophagaceae bacterium]|nr:hypothetical protein [Chitinophagaceae bacterium]